MYTQRPYRLETGLGLPRLLTIDQAKILNILLRFAVTRQPPVSLRSNFTDRKGFLEICERPPPLDIAVGGHPRSVLLRRFTLCAFASPRLCVNTLCPPQTRSQE